MTPITVTAAYDAEAGVWFVEDSDLPGLNLEASSVEQLRDRLPGAILDLLEAAGEAVSADLSISLVARSSVSLRGELAA